MASSSGRRKETPIMFFKVMLDPNADSLRIPPEFTKRMGHNLPSPVLLKVPSGATMEVELNYCNGEAMLERGWREFTEPYSLEFGHFLVFEYNDKSDHQFNVTIFDKSAVEIDYSAKSPKTGDTRKVKPENHENTTLDDVIKISNDYKRGKRKAVNDPIQNSDDIGLVKLDDSTPEECWDGVERERAVLANETSMAYKKAMDFVSVPKNPFFICLMQPSIIIGRTILSLSISFAKQNLCCEGSSSIILVTNGKEWPGRCIVRDNRAFVTVGWKKFVQDNGLKVGDACVFEVANKRKNHVLNVVIFRKSACVGMATHSSRRLAAPKFCKIILDPRADTLIIPPVFTDRIGHTLPNRVFLKVSSTAMEVELVRTNNGQTMLQKGWREFKERHSLGFGHFLVFEYNEDSESINVVVFDKSGVGKRVVSLEEPKLGDERNSVNAENQENITQQQVRRRSRRCDDVIEISDDDIYPLKKSLRTTTHESESKSKFAAPNYHFERKPDHCRLKLDNETTYEGCSTGRRFSKGVEMQRAIVKEETSTAFQKAKLFASAHVIPKKNPFHISIRNYSSVVFYGCSLYVPLSFAKVYLDANSVSLVSNGKTWVVRCLVRDMQRARLSGGWKAFVQDNRLKVGDVCIFEAAINKSAQMPIWNVIVFRS